MTTSSAPPSSVAPASPALAHRISYAFARAHGVLPLRDENGAVVVLARADASVEGIAELKRVLQRPLKMLTVNAERFAHNAIAQAYSRIRPAGRPADDRPCLQDV